MLGFFDALYANTVTVISGLLGYQAANVRQPPVAALELPLPEPPPAPVKQNPPRKRHRARRLPVAIVVPHKPKKRKKKPEVFEPIPIQDAPDSLEGFTVVNRKGKAEKRPKIQPPAQPEALLPPTVVRPQTPKPVQRKILAKPIAAPVIKPVARGNPWKKVDVDELCTKFEQLNIHETVELEPIPFPPTTLPRIRIEPHLYQLMVTLEKSGSRAFLYGGFVRDKALDLQPADADLCIGASPEKVGALLGSAWIRNENKKRRNHFFNLSARIDVKSHSTLSKKDAKQSDYSLNALYADKEGRIYDPLNRARDLTAKYLRIIGEPRIRFLDPEVIMRGVYLKFAVNKEFSNDDFHALKNAAHQISSLPFAVYLKNIEKLFLRGHAWAIFKFLDRENLLSAFIPQLKPILSYRSFRHYTSKWYAPKLGTLDSMPAVERVNYPKERLIAILLTPRVASLVRFERYTREQAITKTVADFFGDWHGSVKSDQDFLDRLQDHLAYQILNFNGLQKLLAEQELWRRQPGLTPYYQKQTNPDAAVSSTSATPQNVQTPLTPTLKSVSI